MPKKVVPKKTATKTPIAYEITLEEEKLRLTTAQADKLELENQIKRLEFVRTDIADKYYGDMVFAFRSKVMAVPNALAQELSTETDPAVIQKIMETRLNECLRDLSQSALSYAVKNKKI